MKDEGPVASLLQKSLVFLGLVDEEQLDEETEERVVQPRHAEPARPEPARKPERQSFPLRTGEIRGRRVEPPAAARRSETPTSSRSPQAVRPISSTDTQTQVIKVLDFDHAKLLADRIRDRIPVILDLRETEPDMVRRIIDFSTGLTYALDGSMRKTSNGVILVTPPRVSIGREEKRRLAELGLYDLDVDR